MQEAPSGKKTTPCKELQTSDPGGSEKPRILTANVQHHGFKSAVFPQMTGHLVLCYRSRSVCLLPNDIHTHAHTHAPWPVFSAPPRISWTCRAGPRARTAGPPALSRSSCSCCLSLPGSSAHPSPARPESHSKTTGKQDQSVQTRARPERQPNVHRIRSSSQFCILRLRNR